MTLLSRSNLQINNDMPFFRMFSLQFQLWTSKISCTFLYSSSCSLLLPLQTEGFVKLSNHKGTWQHYNCIHLNFGLALVLASASPTLTKPDSPETSKGCGQMVVFHILVVVVGKHYRKLYFSTKLFSTISSWTLKAFEMHLLTVQGHLNLEYVWCKDESQRRLFQTYQKMLIAIGNCLT